MNYALPAGYYDSSDEGSEYESGFSENSVDGNEETTSPSTSLQKAIQQGDLDEIDVILSKITNYESFTLDNGLKPLVYAASIGTVPVVNHLLKYDVDHSIGVDVYASYTPLLAACSSYSDESDDRHDDRLACIELLLSQRQDPNFKDRYGETALMRACKCAHVSLVNALLDHGARINDVDNDGWSPLFYATSRGDLELVQFLLARGADPTKVDKRNRYAYSIAIEKGFSELSDILKPEGENSADNFVLPIVNSSIFDEDDVHYYGEVLEMVASTSAAMRRYVPNFADKRLTLRDFLLLKSEQDLRDLGILFSGHRKKILARIKQFHLGSWLPNSFGLTEKNNCSQLLALFNFVATLHRQLYVLQTSLEYVKNDTYTLKSEDGLAVIDVLKNAKYELLLLNKRMASLRCHLYSINVESRPYLTAEEISD